MMYDIAVIGAGDAGLGAALAAARARARVLLICHQERAGGRAIPGHAAVRTLVAAARQGLPYPEAAARIRAAAAQVAAAGRAEALRGKGIDLLYGHPRLCSASQVVVARRRVQAAVLVLATGARPTLPELPGLATIGHLTSETVGDLSELPPSLAVIGGGPVGCALAQAFARLGSRVTLLEAAGRLLPREEPPASQALAAALARDGVAVRTGAHVTAVSPGRLVLATGDQIGFDRLLVAAGQTPNTGGLDLAAAGVATDPQGQVVTDDYLRTTAVGVWAVGEVTGRPPAYQALPAHGMPLAGAGQSMGQVAVGNILSRWGRLRRYRSPAAPWVTCTDPEVARVGLTGTQAARQVRKTQVVHLALSEIDRALVTDRPDGLVVLVAGHRRLAGTLGGGRLLGTTIVAQRAGELMSDPALAIATRAFPGLIAATSKAYPTWSAAVQRAAAQLGQGIGGRWSTRPVRSVLP